MAAGGTVEERHILDQAENLYKEQLSVVSGKNLTKGRIYRHIDLLKHIDPLDCVLERDVLRSGDYDRTCFSS